VEKVSGDLGTICGMIHILQSRGHIVWVRLWETPYLVPALRRYEIVMPVE